MVVCLSSVCFMRLFIAYIHLCSPFCGYHLRISAYFPLFFRLFVQINRCKFHFLSHSCVYPQLTVHIIRAIIQPSKIICKGYTINKENCYEKDDCPASGSGHAGLPRNRLRRFSGSRQHRLLIATSVYAISWLLPLMGRNQISLK